jgi:hypothetical protein
MDVRIGNFRLWAYPLMGPPVLASMLIVDATPRVFLFVLAAFTPGTLILMCMQAQKRGSHPGADERTLLRIGASLSLMVLVLAGTFLALRAWGAAAGGIGTVLYYLSIWFAARHVAARMAARQARKVGAREGGTI